jgi:hypothetical protein
MASFFGWLDYSERERRRNLDVIDLFREKDTRDELGVGVVRDAFADLLFPGTSTIQTRARYFLFVSWIYRDLERRKVESAQITDRARREETRLIQALMASEDQEGIIGSRAGKHLKRLPSNIYWQGLATWGIRQFGGSQTQYHRYLDSFYRVQKRQRFTDDGEPLDQTLINWHSGLPDSPDKFPKEASFQLSLEEAQYLRERILSEHAHSLLAFLVTFPAALEVADFPWQLSATQQLPKHLREQLAHARYFSEVIHGSALLYNLMLAEKTRDSARIDFYQDALQNWADTINQNRRELLTWDRQAFWSIIEGTGARIPFPTRGFINRWLDIALEVSHITFQDRGARQLVSERERSLKRGQARLFNQRALELWRGAAGTAQLNYRWGTVQQIIEDIRQGLVNEGTHA